MTDNTRAEGKAAEIWQRGYDAGAHDLEERRIENDRLSRQLAEAREAITMADNRLEAALLGEPSDVVCRDCVEVARSYLHSAAMCARSHLEDDS